MFRVSFILFFFFLNPQFSFGGPLIRDLPVCETALMGRPFTEAELAGPHPVKTSDLTVIVESQQQNYDGTHQYVLKRKGREWNSAHTPSDLPNAPVGSPFAFAVMMGSRLAHYFGYSIVDSSHILVPSIQTLDRRIDELNFKLVAQKQLPIATRFYFVEGLQDGDRYNREFATRAAFPISEDPVIFLHDLSFHLGSIAMPPDLVLAAQKVTFAVNLFSNELKIFQPKASRKERVVYRWSQEQLVENESQLIDFLFGNIVGLYTRNVAMKLEKLKKPEPKDDDDLEEFSGASIIQSQIWNFFTEQRKVTLRTVVQERFRHMLDEVMYWSENPEEQMTEPEILAILDARLEELIKKTPEVDWNSELPQFNAVEIFAAIEKRIAAMTAAIETP